MKQVFVSQNLVEVESLKECLEQAGIPCTIKNQRASGLAGMVPFAEVFPELWVLKDQDYDRAKELLEETPSTVEDKKNPWTCSGCGEVHTNAFSVCWKCGKERDSRLRTRGFRPEPDDLRERISHAPTITAFVLGVIIALGGQALWNYLTLKHIDHDRNADGKVDEIYTYEGGVLHDVRADDDFDGYFESHYEINRLGVITRGEIDRNKDGKPDLVEHYALGKYVSKDILDVKTGKVVKKAFYKLGLKIREEIDQDGDGKFERIIYFDEFEFPRAEP